MTVVVTAATGRTGLHVIQALRAKGINVRATARSERVHALAADGVTTAAADLANVASLVHAFHDAEAIVHYNPGLHQSEAQQGINAIDAASAAGVRRFVFVSVYHSQIECLLNNQAKARVEDYLVGSSLDYTILQPIHYVDTFDLPRIIAEGVLPLPYSVDRRLAFITLGDTATAAANVLTEPGHVYATYPLCGPDILSGREVAAIIAEAASTDVEARQLPLEDVVSKMVAERGLSWYTADLFRRMWTYYGAHGVTGNPNVLRWVLGREPTSVSDYIDKALADSRKSANLQ